MEIAGFQKISLIDYPGKISAILFIWGCNLHCNYCHNPELVDPKLKPPAIPEKEIFDFLDKRKKILDGITVTGGEPTLYKELPDFLSKIKEYKLLVKLDTNGTCPQMLEKVIQKNLVDYLAMDIKAPLEKYKEVVGKEIDLENIKKSIKIIMGSKIDYEFRSTLLPDLHNQNDIIEMAKLIKGAKRYVLQTFIPQSKLLNLEFKDKKPYSQQEMEYFAKICQGIVKECAVR